MIRSPFGKTLDGTAVELFRFANTRGTECVIMSYGATLVSLRVRDRAGAMDDVVLGCDSLAGYLAQPAYLGAIVGRYANRIARGRFTLDGRAYQLAANVGPNHLHGGIKGFDKVVWQVEPFKDTDGSGVELRHTSPDGDEGYPGRLSVRVRYTLRDDDALLVDFEAESSAPTPLNLTQHSYFNLAGQGDVLGHELMIEADAFTPVDAALMPTGKILSVEKTPLDFRAPRAIGARIADPHPQLRYAGGYDHNFVLRRAGPGLVHAARLREAGSGRLLDVFTTEPGLQLYSGNFLDGTITGKGGRKYGRHAGLCLETQHYPDSPNQPSFPSTILRPGHRYQSRTEFRFGVDT